MSKRISSPFDPSPDPSFAPPSAQASPLYQQIKGLLIRSLQQGQWQPGEVIPSEMELAARYKVSQGTVRKAIDELAIENLLVRRQGKGTFVATHAEAQTQYRFLRLRPDQSNDPGKESPSEPVGRQVLDCKRIRPPAHVAKALTLAATESAVWVRRVLFFAQKPAVFDEIWLHGHLFKGLTAERLRDYQGAMYALFEKEFGVHMIRAEEKVKAVGADATAASVLQVPLNSALLRVERLSYTYDDQPVELRFGLYNTEHHHYRNTLG